MDDLLRSIGTRLKRVAEVETLGPLPQRIALLLERLHCAEDRLVVEQAALRPSDEMSKPEE